MKIILLKSIKKYSKIALFLFAPIAMTNCGDDTPTFFEQEPLADYIVAAGFDEETDTIIDNSSDFEFGFSFIPTVAGQINAIVARIPDANPTLRVTIWDFDTETVLKTVTLNVAAANSTATLEITPLVLEKNKEYMITMNSNDYYERYKTDITDAIYPISAGDINVTGYQWRPGSTQTFPTNIGTDYYAGDASFIFQEIAE
jgi:hypothetical protein